MKHLGGDGSPLHLPIRSVGLSDEFSDVAMAHGFNTLYQFQQLSIADLLKLEWFTAPMFRELAVLLKKLHKLLSA